MKKWSIDEARKILFPILVKIDCLMKCHILIIMTGNEVF
jgi:hypothetical protein